MACLSGVIVSILISLTSIPTVYFVTESDVLSEPLTMMIIGFSALLVVSILCKMFLMPKPNEANDYYLETRGLLYYTCCVFMWASIADLSIQARHLELFGLKRSTHYFEFGEVYLKTPFGIATQLWNAIINPIFYVIIIYQIDNLLPCRNVALYWASNMLTSQFVVLIGSLSGMYSDQLHYSCWMNAIFALLPLWVLYHYITKPRLFPKLLLGKEKLKSSQLLNTILILGLLFSSCFSVLRGLGATNSKIPLILWYVNNFEPYLQHPAQFGASWAIYTALYGIPFQLIAIHGVLQSGCPWMLDYSIVYASATVQGTFVYMSYSWFPSSESEYRIPHDSFPFVLALNLSLVFLSHALMLCCLNNPGYFLQRSDPLSNKKKKS